MAVLGPVGFCGVAPFWGGCTGGCVSWQLHPSASLSDAAKPSMTLVS